MSDTLSVQKLPINSAWELSPFFFNNLAVWGEQVFLVT